MTKGSIFPLLISFTIPLYIGNIFQQLYSMVDTIIVGRFAGVDALAAVGSTGGFSFMVIGFAIGLTQGFSAIISQRYGANDRDGMRKAYTHSIIASLFVGLIISALFFGLSNPMLKLVNTPENIIGMAHDYISIIYAFLLCSIFYNLFSSVLRALGDSKSPVLFLLISSFLNIVLDLLFVIVIQLAALGVAIATVISQGIAAIVSFIYIRKKYPVFRTERTDWKIDKRLLRSLLSIGIPGAIQFSVCAVGVIIIQAFLNGFGSDAIAAYSVGSKIENVITQFYPALGIAMSTFAGQNLGSGQIDRIRKGFKVGLLITVCYSILALFLAQVITEPLCYVFVDRNTVSQEIIDMAIQYTITVSFFFAPLGMILLYRTGAQGLGSGFIPMYSSVTELIVRVIATLILPGMLGYLGICLASPCAWICAGFTLPIFTARLLNKKEALLTATTPK